MPPSFLQRNSNHRSLENIWCIATARAPGHILPLPRWRYGPMANANFFLVRHGFSFLRQSQHSQHWQLPGHPDRIKSLMDSAEVPLVYMHLSNDQRAGVRCCTTLRKARFTRGSSMSSGLSGRVKIIPTVAQIPLFVLGVSNFETFWDNATHWFWKSILLSQTGMNDAQEKASPTRRRVLNWWLLYEQRC